MSDPKGFSDPEKYTIGWISALSIELTAARLFLERKHDPPNPDKINKDDSNVYTLGEINGHNIVIAVMPHGEYGTTTAASVALNMLHSFPNLRVALMVGIGGGAPTPEKDIRLGDVVVSIPKDGKGGVYQYDFGKRIQDREFQTTGHLNQPPYAVLTAVSQLISDYHLEGQKIDKAIECILDEKPKLRKLYGRPPPDADVLYASHVVHPVDGKSSSCKEVCMTQSPEIIGARKRVASHADSPDYPDKRRRTSTSHERDLDPATFMPDGDDKDQRVRDDRKEARLSRTIHRSQKGIEDDDPAIHYGLIASGNSLMKDASMRDELATKVGVLCFEMEAAGIMNNLPCLVVRGICDYSDSHKNDEWHGYAAMTAAAYTRDLLRVMIPKRVESENRITLVLKEFSQKLTSIQNSLESSQEQHQVDCIKEWLSPSDPSINLENNLRQRQQGTCRWLLDSETYHSWRTTPGSFFWLHGLSGCGKTVLASSVIEQLRSQTPKSLFAYFYFDVNGGGRRDLSQMLRSVLCQLFLEEGGKDVLLSLYRDCGMGLRQPSIKQLSDTFASILHQVGEVTIVVDALDECSTPEDVVLWLQDPSRFMHNWHLLVTSQKHGTMSSVIDSWHRQDQIHAVQIDKVNSDIACYVHERLFGSAEFVKWSSHQGLREQVEDEILKQANGMFRLAACQLDDLKPCIDRPRLLAALQTLPKTLQEIYRRILDKLRDSNCFREALFMLQYVLWSERPLDFLELVDAIAVRLEESPVFKSENRLFDLMDVITQCSSLLTVVNKTNYLNGIVRQEVYLAHSSVKEYLTSQNLVRPFDVDLSEVQANAVIAKTCIEYIIEVANLQKEATEHPTATWRVLNVFDFPFAWRATYWMYHAKVIENVDNEVVQVVMKLYKQKHLIHHFPQIVGLCLSHKFGSYEYRPISIEEFANPDPLIHACHWGLEVVVRHMLDNGIDPDSRGCIDSPLHAASYNGHYKIVEMLLQKHADVNGQSRHLGSAAPVPLIGASRNGHYEIVQILLQHGASLSLHDFDHRTAIEIAASRGHASIVKHLADANAYYPLRPDVYELAIVEATKICRVEIVRCLAQHITFSGSRSRTKKLFSALIAAVDHDCYETASVLLLTGAYKNTCLNPAAVSAIGKRSVKILDLLLEHGANPLGCNHSPEDSLVPHSEVPNLWVFGAQPWLVDDRIMSLLWNKYPRQNHPIFIWDIARMVGRLLARDNTVHTETSLTKLIDSRFEPFNFEPGFIKILDQKHPTLAKVLLERSLQCFPGIHSEVTLSILSHHMDALFHIRTAVEIRYPVDANELWYTKVFNRYNRQRQGFITRRINQALPY